MVWQGEVKGNPLGLKEIQEGEFIHWLHFLPFNTAIETMGVEEVIRPRCRAQDPFKGLFSFIFTNY